MKYAAIAALLSATASSENIALDDVCAASAAGACGTPNRCALLTEEAKDGVAQGSACVIPANCVAATAVTITIAGKEYTVTANSCTGLIMR
jgi:hypothetical protein